MGVINPKSELGEMMGSPQLLAEKSRRIECKHQLSFDENYDFHFLMILSFLCELPSF